MPAGLQYPAHLDVDALDILGHRPSPHAPIRALSAEQFARLHLAHACLDTPDHVLFPFLHGLESDNAQQIAFFAKSTGVPAYRGLVWVIADEDIDPLPSPVQQHDDSDSDPDDEFEENDDDIYAPCDSLQDFSHIPRGSISSTSSSSLSDSWQTSTTDTSLVSSAQSLCLSSSTSLSTHSRMRSHLLTSTFFPHELLTLSPSGPIFTPPKVPEGVSLRNFGIQAPIYATLSDIVVYSPKGQTPAALAVAERFKQAIEAKAIERAKTLPPDASPLPAYNVFVVTDPFTTFETLFSPLVSIAADGMPTPSYPDLATREKDEMRQLTAASEIMNNVWLGNAADVPVWHPGDSDDPGVSTNNPQGYDICIECQDGAPFPTAHHLRQAEDHLNALEALWATGFSAAGAPAAGGNAGTGGASPPTPRPAPNANAVLHLTCPSSPSSTQSTLSQLLALVDFVIRASGRNGLLSSGRAARNPLRVLVHSADGYTDSSVLALCLIMSSRHCSLPEAYLELQVARSRSFFVYQQDLPLLKRIEAKLVPPAEQLRKREREKSRDSEKHMRSRERDRSHDRWNWTFARSAAVAVPGTPPSESPTPVGTPGPAATEGALFPPMSSSAPTTPAPIAVAGLPIRRNRASTSALPAGAGHHSWFNDPRFDGSFPSRVLPFLYLGNLNHASNAYMLHALGITHVVSVGECALVPPPTLPNNNSVGAGGAGRYCPSAPHVQGSLWIEEREGRIKVLDIKGVCDDGIDSLRSEFASICDWIDKARLEGGKVLVHCRVGVSRSATVTIAYVMKHLGLPLIDAYLIVRSRRLSVLIQPNMRLLYNLVGWEAELAHQKVQAELAQESAKPTHPSPDDMVTDSPVDLETKDSGDETVTSTPRLLPSAVLHQDWFASPDYMARLRAKLARSLTWPYLAREVHLLNEKYLS